MVQTIYIIILIYFLLGSIGFYFINRKKQRKDAKRRWTKFLTYFIIINILFFSIVIDTLIFRYLTILIIVGGLLELIKLFKESGFKKVLFFIDAVVIYGGLSVGFYFFSEFQMGIILFTFLVLSVFDSFSQIIGQLWGRARLFPEISPNKTMEGAAGGAGVALLSSFLFKNLVDISTMEVLILSTAIIFSAFGGDILASFYKRKYFTKDFSRLIPGHGGVLDRFDSFIAGGACVTLIGFVMNF